MCVAALTVEVEFVGRRGEGVDFHDGRENGLFKDLEVLFCCLAVLLERHEHVTLIVERMGELYALLRLLLEHLEKRNRLLDQRASSVQFFTLQAHRPKLITKLCFPQIVGNLALSSEKLVHLSNHFGRLC